MRSVLRLCSLREQGYAHVLPTLTYHSQSWYQDINMSQLYILVRQSVDILTSKGVVVTLIDRTPAIYCLRLEVDVPSILTFNCQLSCVVENYEVFVQPILASISIPNRIL